MTLRNDTIGNWKNEIHGYQNPFKAADHITAAYHPLVFSEENKYLNTLLFCKFSHLEIMEGSEVVIVGACPL